MAPVRTISLRHPRRIVLPLLLAPLLVLAAMVSTARVGEAESGSYSIWSSGVTPRVAADADPRSATLGVRFVPSTDGWVHAIRFYKSRQNSGVHEGTLYSSDGRVLARVTFAKESREGWQEARLSRPVAVTSGQSYVAAYHAPAGHYADDVSSLSAGNPTRMRALTALQGVFTYGKGMPTSTWRDSNYYVDVRFSAAPVIGRPTTTGPATSTSTGRPTTTTTASPTRPPSSTTSPTTVPTTKATTTTPPAPTTTRPSSTTTTTPPAAPRTGCASRPSACGFPDASTTGVPSGVTLKNVPADARSGPGWAWDPRGWVAITGDGAVFDGYAVPASISVEASNVTIRNVRVTENGESFGIALRHTGNVTITDTEITSPSAGTDRLMVGIKDIYGDSRNLKVLRTDISHTGTGIQVESGLLQDNYIHAMGYKAGDHVNGTTSNGGTQPLTIRHNTIFNQVDQTDAISLFQDFGPQSNRVIDDNLLAGGGYTIYAGANAGRETGATNIDVTNNRIARTFYRNGGSYGPVAAYVSGQGNSFTGNVWDDTGAPLTP